MVENEKIIKIKNETKEFFQKMGFEIEIEGWEEREEGFFFNLKVKDNKEAQILIGENGQILNLIQQLLIRIIKRKISLETRIVFDINDYRKKKIAHLKVMAKRLADEVVLEKKEKVLPPMPAFERRVIHLELANRNDVTTQSIGEEPNRRVVIKLYS